LICKWRIELNCGREEIWYEQNVEKRLVVIIKNCNIIVMGLKDLEKTFKNEEFDYFYDAVTWELLYGCHH